MNKSTIEIGELMLRNNGSINPKKYEDEVFELYSIPAFDKGAPEVLAGKEIGSSKQLVQENDVMISKIVPHIRRASIVGKNNGLRQIASGEWIVFRDPRFHPPYLKHILQSDRFNADFMATVSGVGGSLVRARPAVAAKIEIPLPPLPEQTRIAAILDQADKIRQKRRRAAALADEFLRSVFLEMFGDPVSNPKGWEVRTLGEIASIQIGPFGTQLHKEDYIEDGIPLINPMHINQGTIIPNFAYSISLEKHAELPEYHLKAGDIIMGRRGEMGRCAVVGNTEEGWLCGTGSLFIRPKIDHFSEYLQYVLSNSSMVEYFERQSLGATMPNLNKGIVSNTTIPLPLREDLVKFSKIINRFSHFKKKILHAENNNLFQSLSQQFFNPI